jgi:hypothetical protein
VVVIAASYAAWFATAAVSHAASYAVLLVSARWIPARWSVV